MKSQLLKQALMANYGKGGKVGDPPVKKKNVEAKSPTPTVVKSIDEIPKDAVIEKDPVTGEEYWVKRPKGVTPKTEPKKDPGTPPKPYIPTKGTKKSQGSGKPKDGTKPKKILGTPSTELETEQRWVMKPKTIDKPKVTREMVFGWKGRYNEDFGNPNYVMLDGKPKRIHTYNIPATKDEKTGSWMPYTGSMGPTVVSGYYDDNENFVSTDYYGLTGAKGKEAKLPSGQIIMAYDSATVPSSPYGSDAKKLRYEGAVQANNSQALIDVAKANEVQAQKGEAPINVKNVLEPVNTLFGGLGVGKSVNLDTKRASIATEKGINMPVDTPPIDNLDNYKKNAKPFVPKTMANMVPKVPVLPVSGGSDLPAFPPASSNPNLPSSKDNINLLYKRNKGFKSGGLVKKYGGGGPVINPQLMAGIKDTYAAGRDSGSIDRGDVIGGAVAPIDSTGGLKQSGGGLSKLMNSSPQGIGAAADAVGQIAGTGVDYLDRKDERSSIAGQAGAGALRGAGKGAAIGATIGSVIPGVGTLVGLGVGAAAGALIGGGAGGARGKKEKTERIRVAGDEMRDSVAAQQRSDSKDTYKSESFREEDTKRGLRGLFAKGGTIKGEGTGTSDSIKTKMGKEGIQENSFVVPAKNNGLAKLIRKDILGDSPNKEAKFKKGGNADMAVSNGEHLFTPAEKKKITAYLGQEILEELAPEAEENEESEDKKYGGMLKRADGSYSKRGLWDNIRANAGSGKKPTPEMLKQEKKIKDSYAGGGYVVQRSGDREGKTHKVTGPDGTVKYFGDPNLGQHPKDTARKEAFYARHKNNLDNNPHFRAYAKETWAKGGTVGTMDDRTDMEEYKNGGLTKSKAATMLHEGMVNGKPITDQQRKYFAVVASGKAKYANGGNVENTTKRMTSSGNAALDAEIDLLYKTGNWRSDAVDKIEAKAKALGLDVGDNPLSPSLRTGVFKDLKYKKDYFNREVNKELQNKKQQQESQMRRFAVAPNAPKGLSDADKQTYLKLKKDVVVGGKDLAPLQKFVAEKKDSLEESNKFQGQLKRGVETGKDYAKKYQLAQDLKAKLEYAKKNADKFTAEELKSAAEQEKAASLAYSKLKTPSQYATPNNKRLDVIYEGFAKKQYKPTQVEQRSAAPILQEKIEVKPVVQAVKPAAPAVTPVAAQDTQKVVTTPVKPVVVPPVTKVAPTKKKVVTAVYVDEDF